MQNFSIRRKKNTFAATPRRVLREEDRGRYGFKIRETKFNEDTSRLILRGIPFSIENGKRVYYETVPLCVKTTYDQGEEDSSVIAGLYQILNVKFGSEINLNELVGMEIVVDVDICVDYTATNLFYNVEHFLPMTDDFKEKVEVSETKIRTLRDMLEDDLKEGEDE
jgi:hypothetical protein